MHHSHPSFGGIEIKYFTNSYGQFILSKTKGNNETKTAQGQVKSKTLKTRKIKL